jgi:predicted DNA-binding transcriptional regulator YafY
MDKAEKEETKRVPVTNLPDGDLSEKAANYPRENASHFLGSRIPIDIRCDKKWLGSVRDIFGYDNVMPVRSKKDTYRILTVDAEGLYISLMQLGSKIEVLSPESVRETLAEKIRELMKVYMKD